MDKKTNQFSIISTFLFIILYFGYKHFKEENINSEILGQWESEESKGDNFIFNFLKNDSMIMKKENSLIKLKYEVSENNLRLIEEGISANEYKFTLNDKKLILIQNKDSLVFYKK
ncbi:hypothetical protein EGI26_08725 [Lacihabitans sp. CCS-44]|uniref:hypothetical protein n=1 Tax=Lacihabitans sp. CCS-44 TaxID=2487331 RepID=UPI0020CDAB44|nr:hypothetical protein [Lacihabitans sp. CCS-44]MCP9755235.1 hypothetical protein [Lacihabitans sp. CCS-44]